MDTLKIRVETAAWTKCFTEQILYLQVLTSVIGGNVGVQAAATRMDGSSFLESLLGRLQKKTWFKNIGKEVS
ncbi:hypothetical protein V7654_09910 [Bacillus sp. JJ1609]|uniref:hypothetical protein n=1 Tax=Bacillus sp. JJ1609 TaxID=3122977 RepID=UPI002FFF3899